MTLARSSPSRNDIFGVSWKIATPHVRALPLPPTTDDDEAPTNGLGITAGDSAKWLPSPPSTKPHFRLQQPPPSPVRKGVVVDSTPPSPSLTTSPSLRVRLFPRKLYRLGHGVHATVYLASFSTAHSRRWTLCAAKRPGSDREDQAATLREAVILNRLRATPTHSGKCPYVVSMLGIEDEREFGTAEPLVLADSPLGSTRTHWRSVSNPDATKSPRHADSMDCLTPGPSTFGRSPSPLRRQTSSSTLLSDTTPVPMFNDSPNIDNPPRIVLLLEYCPNGTTFDFVSAFPERVGRGRWSAWASQLAEAVCWCKRQGVVIADLKPQNVLLAEDLTVRLADFNRSQLIAPLAPLPDNPSGIGTSAYSPPELVQPAPSPFGFPADVFSLGVTLCVILYAGREPFSGIRNPVERMMWVSRGGYWEFEERRRCEGGDFKFSGSEPSSRSGSIKSQSNTVKSRSAGHASEILIGSSVHHVASPQSSLRGRRLGFNQIGSDVVEKLLCEEENGASDLDGNEDSDDGQSIIVSSRRRLCLVSPDTLKPRVNVTSPSPTPLPLSASSTTSSSSSSSVATLPWWSEDPDPFPPDEDVPLTTAHYSDSTPLVWFPNGKHVVSEGIRWLLKSMCDPKPTLRPDIEEVVQSLSVLLPT